MKGSWAGGGETGSHVRARMEISPPRVQSNRVRAGRRALKVRARPDARLIGCRSIFVWLDWKIEMLEIRLSSAAILINERAWNSSSTLKKKKKLK